MGGRRGRRSRCDAFFQRLDFIDFLRRAFVEVLDELAALARLLRLQFAAPATHLVDIKNNSSIRRKLFNVIRSRSIFNPGPGVCGALTSFTVFIVQRESWHLQLFP